MGELPVMPGWVLAGRGEGCPAAEGRRGGLAAKLGGEKEISDQISSVIIIYAAEHRPAQPREALNGKRQLVLVQNMRILAITSVDGSELGYETDKGLFLFLSMAF